MKKIIAYCIAASLLYTSLNVNGMRCCKYRKNKRINEKETLIETVATMEQGKFSINIDHENPIENKSIKRCINCLCCTSACAVFIIFGLPIIGFSTYLTYIQTHK